MSIASREAKWTMPSSTRPGQETFGQYRIASSAGRSTGVPQAGQRVGHPERRAARGRVDAVEHRPHHLGDHLAGADDLDPVADADVLLRDQILVVQRRGAHRDARDHDRLQHGVGIERAGAADVDPDLLQAGHGHLGRELPGDGPARLAAAHHAELAVEVEPVHLDHDAVGLERQLRDQLLAGRRSPPAPRPATSKRCAVRLDLEAPGGEQVEQLPVGARAPAGPRPARRRRRTCGAGAAA